MIEFLLLCLKFLALTAIAFSTVLAVLIYLSVRQPRGGRRPW